MSTVKKILQKKIRGCAMLNKGLKTKFVIPLLIFVAILIFLVLIWIFANPAFEKPQAGTAFSNDVIENFLNGNTETSLSIHVPANMCYWLVSTSNETTNLLSIIRFNSSKDCSTDMVDKKDISVQNIFNLRGDTDCLCSGEYTLQKNTTEEINDLIIRKVNG